MGNSSDSMSQERLDREVELVATKLDSLFSWASNAADYGTELLIELDRLAELFKVETSSRQYRRLFTRNYQILFKDVSNRQYLSEFLEVIVEGCPAFYVNGRKYTFSANVEALCGKILIHLHDLRRLIPSFRPGRAKGAHARDELVTLLKNLDSSWAKFEHSYVEEMMLIEAECRKPLVAAAKHARHIPHDFFSDSKFSGARWCELLEKRFASAGRQPPWKMWDELKMLFKHLAELNQTANSARKGRGDITDFAFFFCIDVLRARKGWEDASSLVRCICEDFMESVAAMLRYLCKIDYGLMDEVDPRLQNNIGLVERLADLEEAWELVIRYVKDKAVRYSLESLFKELKATQEFDPTFQQMCCDCDVELFLVIPRLFLLAYLKDPTNDELMKQMLPHAFEGARSEGLKSLRVKYEALLLADADLADFFVFQAVHGVGVDALEELISKDRQRRGVNFMRELEGWSMELQRHQASDWNTLCAVLAQHLSSEYKKDRDVVRCP